MSNQKENCYSKRSLEINIREKFKLSTMSFAEVCHRTNLMFKTVDAFYYDLNEWYYASTIKAIAMALGYYITRKSKTSNIYYISTTPPITSSLKVTPALNLDDEPTPSKESTPLDYSLLTRLDNILENLRKDIQELEDLRLSIYPHQ